MVKVAAIIAERDTVGPPEEYFRAINVKDGNLTGILFVH